MNAPCRKSLDHRGPLSIGVAGAWYSITICATERIDYRAVGGSFFDEPVLKMEI